MNISNIRNNKGLVNALLLSVVLGLLVSFLILYQPLKASAIGLSPPEIYVSSILRGSTQTRVTNVTRSPESINERYVLTTEVSGQYADAIKVPDQVIIPVGVLRQEVEIEIAPGELANGDYEASITFIRYPELQNTSGESVEAVGASISIAEGVMVNIDFTVGGEEVVDYEINNIQVYTTEVEQPLIAGFFAHNKGNVTWQLDGAEIIIEDSTNSDNQITTVYTKDDFPVIQPGKKEVVKLEIPAELEQGSYVAKATFYSGDEEIKLESQMFNIYPPNTLAQKGEITYINVNKNNFEIGEPIKVDVDFINNGEIRVNGLLITEIYKDGTLLDIVRGEEIAVDAGEETVFSQILNYTEAGNYHISTYIEYANKKSNIEVVDIIVSSDEYYTNIRTWIGLIILIIIIMTGTFIYMLRNRKKRKTIKSSKIDNDRKAKSKAKKPHTSKSKSKKANGVNKKK
ncbi:MAG: hypothetical protein Q8P90_00760 [bacterium]|nr:hypothetical protein [bacterium]